MERPARQQPSATWMARMDFNDIWKVRTRVGVGIGVAVGAFSILRLMAAISANDSEAIADWAGDEIEGVVLEVVLAAIVGTVASFLDALLLFVSGLVKAFAEIGRELSRRFGR